MAPTPEQWFNNMPPITKTYFCAAVATTCATSFGLINPYLLYLNFQLVFYQFQIWRLFTCFIYFGNFSLPFLFQIFILVRYFTYLEQGYHMDLRGRAEMIFMMVFGATIMILFAYLWGNILFLGSAMVTMCLYVWSRKDPLRDVVFWGFKFAAWHFPFVMMLFSILLGNSIVLHVVGILSGHLYHFLRDIVPRKYGGNFLKTPEFIFNLVAYRSLSGPSRSGFGGSGNRM